MSGKADEGWRERDEARLSRFSRQVKGHKWIDNESIDRWDAADRRPRAQSDHRPAEPGAKLHVVQDIEQDVKDEQLSQPESVAPYYKKLSESSATQRASTPQGSPLSPEPSEVGVISATP